MRHYLGALVTTTLVLVLLWLYSSWTATWATTLMAQGAPLDLSTRIRIMAANFIGSYFVFLAVGGYTAAAVLAYWLQSRQRQA